MNFFKNLFKNKKVKENSKSEKFSEPKHKDIPELEARNNSKVEFNKFATHEYFDQRYQEEKIDTAMLDGALKMIEGYFIDNKIERKVKTPINHPANLDQTIDDGFGFTLYCKAVNLEEQHALMFLALAFNDFMINNYGFKLYKDSEPEFPLRTMTLKYDNHGAKLSLYPIEYTSKVLNFESNFEDLHNRIINSLKNIPTANDVFNKWMDSTNDKSEK